MERDPSQIPAGDRTRKARQRRRDWTRERIITTAARLLQATGYEGLTVEALSEATGVSRTTFYKYFEDKTALLRAMIASVATRVEAAIVPIRGIPQREDASEQVVANMQRVVDVFESSLPLFRLLFGGGRWTAGLEQEAVEALEQRMVSVIRTALEQGIRAGLVRPLDLEVSALTIWGSFVKAILQPLARGTLGAAEARRRIPILVDYHIGGLLCTPAPDGH